MRHAIPYVAALALIAAAPASAGRFAAAPASAGRFAAVWDPISAEPSGRPSDNCRIANESSACGTIFWTLGGWCEGDEVTAYFDLADDACINWCYPVWGVYIGSAEVGFRLAAPSGCGGFPHTTFPFEGQYLIYRPDAALGTPDCPVPGQYTSVASVVMTIPALTATSATDPARSHDQVFPFQWTTFVEDYPLPVFGAFRWVSFSVPESLHVTCGGQSACAWWYPGMRGRNGTTEQTPCAAPCTQYYRNVSVYGPGWFESEDAGLGRATDFAHWINVCCGAIGCEGVPVKRTTWGKLKSLMHD